LCAYLAVFLVVEERLTIEKRRLKIEEELFKWEQLRHAEL